MLFLGIDSSTQGIKYLVVDSQKGVVANIHINFGEDLPEYASPHGFLENTNPLIKHSNPLMWLDALELGLQKLAVSGIDLSEIKGISGSGQQHGSVYLKEKIPDWRKDKKLSEQAADILSRKTAPIWMDHSTSAECQELITEFGAKMLRNTTGSSAIERFTGPQIRKFAKIAPEKYAQTTKIHLVSSFLCSVLCGADAPIDYADASGMNLFDLNTLTWNQKIANFTAPNLLSKLPDVVPSNTIVGGLCSYFSKYHLTPGIPVIAWSGDNPNSLIGIGACAPGTAGISLGTSDTFFAPMAKFTTDPQGCGHVFADCASGFMSLICFTNGSLAREKIKNECGCSWKYFDQDFASETIPGNNGKLLLPYFEAENTPLVLIPGIRKNFINATNAEKIRALLETQALSMCLHSAWQKQTFSHIRLTGGASKSTGFQQILADVFQAQIETIQSSDSASLGAAFRAINAVTQESFSSLSHKFCKIISTTAPILSNAPLYNQKRTQLSTMEKENIHSNKKGIKQ
ncbi:MAG: FGGY family carbohydrate kinase [Lentisphaeria bacterium]